MWLQAEECGWYTEGSKELDKLRQNNQICILERLIRQQCVGGAELDWVQRDTEGNKIS